MKPLIRNHDGTLTVAEEGDGWVVVKVSRFAEMNPGDTIVSMTNNPDLPITVRRYVPPVPPLPTVPYTVIEATWRNGEVLRIWLVSGSGVGALWVDSGGRPVATSGVTGFEVLAEPRAVTAQTIASWFELESDGFDPSDWRFRAAQAIRHEFTEVVAREVGVEP